MNQVKGCLAVAIMLARSVLQYSSCKMKEVQPPTNEMDSVQLLPTPSLLATCYGVGTVLILRSKTVTEFGMRRLDVPAWLATPKTEPWQAHSLPGSFVRSFQPIISSRRPPEIRTISFEAAAVVESPYNQQTDGHIIL